MVSCFPDIEHRGRIIEPDRPSLRTHLPATAALTCCFGFVEKRQKFDNGEDPLDPEQQQQGGGGPFWHEGFNPFGGSGFKFKFNFN